MMLRDSLSNRGSFSLVASSTQPPLRFGDDAEDSLSNRRVIKKPRFLMRGDSQAGVRSALLLSAATGGALEAGGEFLKNEREGQGKRRGLA